MSLLAFQNVSVDLGGRRVLTDVSAEIQEGEFVGVLGPNGAGKTTTIRACLGLVPLSGGSVQIEGKPPKQHRAKVGYVPQRHEFAWDFPISVGDAVVSARVRRAGWLRQYRTEDYRAAARAIARVELTDLAKRPVGELSGGQKQRVLVARALALEPKLLLLDEPFTGVDMPTQEQLTALFKELAAEGKAVVMSTHDLISARAECSRLMLINGRIVADGAPDSLMQAQIWTDTFQVGADNPLLASLGVQ